MWRNALGVDQRPPHALGHGRDIVGMLVRPAFQASGRGQERAVLRQTELDDGIGPQVADVHHELRAPATRHEPGGHGERRWR